MTKPVLSINFTIHCVCVWRRDIQAKSQEDAINKLRQLGWRYPQKDAEGDLKGICGECQELMDEDE